MIATSKAHVLFTVYCLAVYVRFAAEHVKDLAVYPVNKRAIYATARSKISCSYLGCSLNPIQLPGGQ